MPDQRPAAERLGILVLAGAVGFLVVLLLFEWGLLASLITGVAIAVIAAIMLART